MDMFQSKSIFLTDMEVAVAAVAVAVVEKVEAAALAMGREVDRALDMGPVQEPMVEDMEAAEEVEVGVDPVGGVEVGVARDMGPAVVPGTVRAVVTMVVDMEVAAVEVAVAVKALALGQATGLAMDPGMGVVGDTVAVKS